MSEIIGIAPLIRDVGIIGGLFVLFFYVVARSPVAIKFQGRFCIKIGQHELEIEAAQQKHDLDNDNIPF